MNNGKIEENNRMGKTRDLFRKIGNTKRTFHVQMGTIKNRNGKNLKDILECEVKSAIASITPIKARGVNGILTELFQILKDDAVKVLH